MRRRMPDRRPSRAYPGRGLTEPSEGVPLSDDVAAATSTSTEDAVLQFVGGPLDGRVEVREARHGAPLPTITHVHLHAGPKVVHRYDLQSADGQGGVYQLRPPVRRAAHDESPTG
ncbi:hypothetical protein SAMN05661080_02534 [Modestobacter sp. DSM 44400]|nr:hypothetical protein SAMN05661080_02534 [Modestobacter sp. DSM 44400]